MSTPFNVRQWAREAGIETSGGFSVIAECVTLDELERFAQIAISQYAASQNKKWQGLTDEEVRTAYCTINDKEWAIGGMSDAEPFARAIESRLKEKNT